MGVSEKGICDNALLSVPESAGHNIAPARPVPCNDERGRVLPITPEEHARDTKAIAAFVELMYALPDEDPPGAWEEAMRDLDAHRPHRKLFEGPPILRDRSNR
jgi:hypothetical protein